MRKIKLQNTAEDCTTTTCVSKLLGLSVISIHLLVQRGELIGWKTPEGRRRILLSSIAQHQLKDHEISHPPHKLQNMITVVIDNPEEQPAHEQAHLPREPFTSANL